MVREAVPQAAVPKGPVAQLGVGELGVGDPEERAVCGSEGAVGCFGWWAEAQNRAFERSLAMEELDFSVLL